MKAMSVCVWTAEMPHDTDVWDTSCGQRFLLDSLDGGPVDQGMEFCCYCGKPLWQEYEYPDDEESGDGQGGES